MIVYGNRKRCCALNNLRVELESFRKDWEFSTEELKELLEEIIEDDSEEEFSEEQLEEVSKLQTEFMKKLKEIYEKSI